MENKQYHIGKEIEKEMIAQGMSVRELAEKIFLSPQAVYDIFKKNHIATDRLAEIQRVLGRDFFKELSQQANNGSIPADSAEEDEAVLQERFEMLMPEDRLRVLELEAFYQLVEEFINTEHHKPLVVFYNDWRLNAHDRIQAIADHDLGTGQVLNVDYSKERKAGQSDDGIINKVKTMPHPILEVVFPCTNEGLNFLVKLAEDTGKKVYGYCEARTRLGNDSYGNLTYCDPTIELFGAWHKLIHFVYVDDEWMSYRKIRQLYLVKTGYDLLSFLWANLPDLNHSEDQCFDAETILRWFNDPKQLVDYYRSFIETKAPQVPCLKAFNRMYLDDEVTVKQLSDTRWEVGLIVTKNDYNFSIEGARLSMWVDVNNECIIDNEYSIIQQSIN